MRSSGGHIQKPGQADALHALGVSAMRDGQYERAVECLSQAIALNGTVADYYQDLSLAMQGLGALTSAAARCLCRVWPHDAQLWRLLGDALFQEGDILAAADAYRAALDLCPTDGPALRALAFVLEQRSEHENAILLYRRALALTPEDAALYHNLGDCLRQVGRLDQAYAALEQAVRLAPDVAKSQLNLAHLQQLLCAWEGLEDRWARIRSALMTNPDGAINPFFFLSIPSTAAEQLACARAWSVARYGAEQDGGHLGSRPHAPGPRRRLHIGYLSADLREHAVARLIAEVFEQHDRSGFIISAYSIGPNDQSALRERLIRGTDRFVDLTPMSDTGAAERVCADGVDLLVDLNGYTSMNRAGILALRPAPIQVSYWGFPGTTGAWFIDYAIVDRFVVPPAHQVHFSERLVYLPHCYMPNDRKRAIAPETPSRAACGLPEEGFVFCAFNHVHKITPALFALWLRLLAAVPGSALWLLETNQWAPANLRREAARAGIDPCRLVFAPALYLPEHLARYRLADLFLDTLPYNGHTTSCDALWAGLPVLTCSGETFASRVAGSALHAVGLPELVTTSPGDYQALALALAADQERLAALRARLQANRDTAPLFDCARYTRDLETLYRGMWDRYCRAPGL